MEKTSKTIFSVPVYNIRYVGPDDLAPWQHGYEGDGLRFGEFYDVLLGRKYFEGKSAPTIIVRVLDLDFDCGYVPPFSYAVDDWELPDQFVDRR